MMHSLESRPRLFKIKPLLLLLIGLLPLGTVAAGYYRYSRPIDPPVVHQVLQVSDDSAQPVEIEWPAATDSQASIGSVEHGLLASEPNQRPMATASTAKLITVLTVLKKKPLALGEQGPLLTMNFKDVELYNNYYQVGGSVVAIRLGEQLTQYQMLQGILIRSGNNLADSLAIWAFGSLPVYRKAAQEYVDELGLTHTKVGTDASGLIPNTRSTTDDLTRLGIAAMKHEVVREIVRQPTSTLPTDGTRPNTNWMLGSQGVVGLKTGNIPQVGGVFIIASEFTPVGSNPVTIVGAVQGEPTTAAAITAAARLAETAKTLFVKKMVIKKGDVVARVTTAWGATSDIIAAEDITLFDWKYRKVEPELTLHAQAPFEKDTVLGTISVNGHSSKLVAASTVDEPSWQWRLTDSR